MGVTAYRGITFARKYGLEKTKRILDLKDTLYKRYGDREKFKSWAVITGGSHALGQKIAKHLAYQGFNICMIGSDVDLLKTSLLQIKLKCQKQGLKNFESKFIEADFSKMKTLKEYKELLTF